MSVFNKLLQALKFDDDYDDDYDDYDDYDDEFDDYEEEQPKKSKSKKVSAKSYEEEEPPVSTTKKSHSSFRDKAKNDNVTSFSKNESGRSDKMSVSVIRPTSVDDGREICDTLLAKKTVILNIEGLDIAIGQRIFDFTYGATYALGGNLQKVSNYIFLATPAGVDSVGDLQELFEESFNSSSSMRNRY